MSTTVAIHAENLGKKYRIGRNAERGPRYQTFRDAVSEGARRLFSRTEEGGSEAEDFWALRDVNFAIAPGEVVGIVGRNGAGKSTLLKVLSRITEPTTGRIKIAGRVASLLEVGTGFHHELTGRENIYLNGAILGMSRLEIKSRFDEIVAFAEVERFLDTPVKRYSSGMYVRLAFAVAAHLEAEILVVDEVLAVGDADFQKKCLGRMKEVSRGGRTVLLVSHSSKAILSLATRAIMIEKGAIAQAGTPAAVMSYYAGMNARSVFGAAERKGSPSQDTILAAWLHSPSDNSEAPLSTVTSGSFVTLTVTVQLTENSSSYLIASFWDDARRPLWEVVGGTYSLPASQKSELSITFRLPDLAIPSFTVDLALGNNHSFEDHVRDAIYCSVTTDQEYAGGEQRFPLAVAPSFDVRSVSQ